MVDHDRWAASRFGSPSSALRADLVSAALQHCLMLSPTHGSYSGLQPAGCVADLARAPDIDDAWRLILLALSPTVVLSRAIVGSRFSKVAAVIEHYSLWHRLCGHLTTTSLRISQHPIHGRDADP
jgi:hypothetical protein